MNNHLNHPDWGEFAQRVIDWGPNPRNGNKSDQAHPPIHPLRLAIGNMFAISYKILIPVAWNSIYN